MILRLAKLSLNKRLTYWVVILEQGNTKMNGLSMATVLYQHLRMSAIRSVGLL